MPSSVRLQRGGESRLAATTTTCISAGIRVPTGPRTAPGKRRRQFAQTKLPEEILRICRRRRATCVAETVVEVIICKKEKYAHIRQWREKAQSKKKQSKRIKEKKKIFLKKNRNRRELCRTLVQWRAQRHGDTREGSSWVGGANFPAAVARDERPGRRRSFRQRNSSS